MISHRAHPLKCLLSLVVLAHVFFASSAMAEDDMDAWRPKAIEHDWIQLTSGKWLSGTILSMYDDTLEFDSEKLKILSIDWDDVKFLQSYQPFHVLFAAAGASEED